MKRLLTSCACTASLLLASAAPAHADARRLSGDEVAALRAGARTELGLLRAGQREAPHACEAGLRASLRAAASAHPELAALRAGAGPTNNEWTWLAIGAGIVLLIVLL